MEHLSKTSVTKIEKGPNQIPTKEKILEEVGSFIEKFVVARELSDAEGLYLLETVSDGEKPGETVGYNYTRKGRFLNGIESEQTAISVMNFQDGVPVGGSMVSFYNIETGNWIRSTG